MLFFDWPYVPLMTREGTWHMLVFKLTIHFLHSKKIEYKP